MATSLSALTRTLIGKKVLMACSGAVLFAFVVGHMLGNLKVFQGPQHFNDYAEGLRLVGAPFFGRGQLLWVVRGVLLVAVAVHLWAAWVVTRASWAARPVDYRRLDPVATTYAARTMRMGGVLIVLYVVYHLLDLTFGPVNPAFTAGDAYGNLVASLQRPVVAALYVGANVFVGLHLYHGLWSAGQTLGLHRAPTDRWRHGVAGAVAAAITLGYLAVPVAILAGWVR
jgi:succinate dehydrogenase / fumarate reductase cytochrome b subunit